MSMDTNKPDYFSQVFITKGHNKIDFTVDYQEGEKGFFTARIFRNGWLIGEMKVRDAINDPFQTREFDPKELTGKPKDLINQQARDMFTAKRAKKTNLSKDTWSKICIGLVLTSMVLYYIIYY